MFGGPTTPAWLAERVGASVAGGADADHTPSAPPSLRTTRGAIDARSDGRRPSAGRLLAPVAHAVGRPIAAAALGEPSAHGIGGTEDRGEEARAEQVEG